MTYWEGPYRWINAALLAVLAVLSLDGVLRLVGASEDNLIVRGVRALANPLTAPFDGLWEGQPHAVTWLLAVVGWIVLVLVVFAVMRTVEARGARGSRGDRRPPDEGPAPGAG